MNRPPAIRPRLSLVSSRSLPGRGSMLRRVSLGLFSTSLLGGCATPSLWALQTAVVRGDNVNVRGQASLAGEVLAQLNQGDIIQMVEKIVAVGGKADSPSRWAQIQLPPSVPVYVHASFLDGDTVAATKLNIRGGAGENYSVLGSLQRGDKIHSLGKQGGWVRIRPTPETYAFVAADYVVKAPSPAPAAHPVVAKDSPPTRAVPIPVTATVSTQHPPPPASPKVPAERKIVTPEQTSSASDATPIVVAATTAAVRSTTPSLVPPAVTPESAPIQVPAGPTLTRAQAVDPTKQLENLTDKPTASSTTTPPTKDEIGRLEPIHDASRRNQISFGYRFGVNGTVEFKGFALPPRRPAGMFDDGYVLDSSRQTAGSNPAPDGRTWNWGYDSHTQIQGDSLLLSESYLRPGPGSHQLEDDLMSGFEATYSRELFRAGRDESCLFGLEAAINYSALNIKSTWTQSLDLVRDTTTYQLGGVVPPYDPLTGQTYQGNHAGPGPIIPLTGTLSQISIPSVDSMTSHRELAANTYGFRLGPYFESPLYKNILGTVGTGLAIGLVDSDLSYVDTLHSSPRSGSATDFGTLVGWYVGGGLSYKWNQSWSVFYNAQYQWLPDYNLKAGETEARFKAGNALFQSIGIRYSF